MENDFPLREIDFPRSKNAISDGKNGWNQHKTIVFRPETVK
jgi:hypothetical protein